MNASFLFCFVVEGFFLYWRSNKKPCQKQNKTKSDLFMVTQALQETQTFHSLPLFPSCPWFSRNYCNPNKPRDSMLKGKFLWNFVTFPEMHIKTKATEIQQSISSLLKNTKFSVITWLAFCHKRPGWVVGVFFFFSLHMHASSGMHVAKQEG